MHQNPWLKKRNAYIQDVKTSVPKRNFLIMILSILWMAFKRTCTFLGAVMLILIVITVWAVGPYVEEIEQGLPAKMVLHIKFDGALGDLPQESSFNNPFSSEIETVRYYVDALARAKDDPRVVGLYAELKGVKMSLGHIQELRAAIKDFRESGKFAYIYASSYEGGLGAYYLASAFEERWIQPMGVVMINGLNAEVPFARDALDKIGVEPNMYQRKEYKNAYESLTHREMSKANKEAMGVLIQDMAGVIERDITDDLGLDFKALVDQGLFIDHQAFEADLVERVGYVDELYEVINEKVSGDSARQTFSYVKLHRYIKDQFKAVNPFAPKKEISSKPRVALVYAVGAIVDHDEQGNSVNDGVAGAADIAEALYDAARDNRVKAVVLRVDSPGGSPVASETILRAIETVQEAGKTVTVSMGSVAASGGYWISAYADQIFVLPGTITGSIGVLGGKFSLRQMWAYLGINWDHIKWGKNAGMWSANAPFSESEAKQMNAMLDYIYQSFVARVAQGRKMDVEQVEKVARGRVWSGKRAVELGLADQFGGLNDALAYAAKQINEAHSVSDVDVIVMPKPLSPIEQLVKMLEGQVRAGRTIGAFASYLKPLEPAIERIMILQDSRRNSVYAPMSDFR